VAAVLVDASALVALLDRDDRAHGACVDALAGIREMLMTVWPALTEAMYLLNDHPRAVEALHEMVEDGVMALANLDESDLPRMKELMRKYRDTPMDFADAALVRVAERERLNRIVTFDRHFKVYALPRRTRFVVLPEKN
jgi:predicted nucleic acid-binding protein